MNKGLFKHLLPLLFSVCAYAGNVGCSSSDDPGKEGPVIPVTEIAISPEKPSVEVGKTLTLTATITPDNATDKTTTWDSRDKTVATVLDGVVTGVAPGQTTIAVNVGRKTATCTVIVTAGPAAVTGITLSPSGLSLLPGKTATLTATVAPMNAVDKTVIWSSSNPAVATIADGVVTTVAKGSAVITATASGFTATCTLDVIEYQPTRGLKFLQLNLWEGLSNVPNGVQVFVDQFEALEPDVASFCEFRFAGDADNVLQAVIARMAQKGVQYYYTQRSGSGTRGLLSKYKILSTDPVQAVNYDGISSWFYRTVIDFYGQEIALYAAHAFHSYYACYLPRGYGDGQVPYGWDKLPDGPITDVNFILERELKSERHFIAHDFVAEAKRQQQAGRLTIFGGDLNQPSHLDWTEATKNNLAHNGCVVPWQISTYLYEHGIKDAYRTIYPNPATHPGVTWPVTNKDGSIETTWAAEADERDRIDYVYYMPDAKLAVQKAQMVGPSGMTVKSQNVEDTFVNQAEELILPHNNIWASDHRGLLITFQVSFPSPN